MAQRHFAPVRVPLCLVQKRPPHASQLRPVLGVTVFLHPGHGQGVFVGGCGGGGTPVSFGGAFAVAVVDFCTGAGIGVEEAGTVAEAPVGTDPGTFVALGGGDVAIVERGGSSARCNTRRALNASLTGFD